jgi:hypothetical protein
MNGGGSSGMRESAYRLSARIPLEHHEIDHIHRFRSIRPEFILI